jgi:hypothetical protein
MKVIAPALRPEGREQRLLPCRIEMLHIIYEAELQYPLR